MPYFHNNVIVKNISKGNARKHLKTTNITGYAANLYNTKIMICDKKQPPHFEWNNKRVYITRKLY